MSKLGQQYCSCGECGDAFEVKILPRDGSKQIFAFADCRECQEELRSGVRNGSPEKTARLNVGITPHGIQVWCVRHQKEVLHYWRAYRQLKAILGESLSAPDRWTYSDLGISHQANELETLSLYHQTSGGEAALARKPAKRCSPQYRCFPHQQTSSNSSSPR
jgi:hypothetical protein